MIQLPLPALLAPPSGGHNRVLRVARLCCAGPAPGLLGPVPHSLAGHRQCGRGEAVHPRNLAGAEGWHPRQLHAMSLGHVLASIVSCLCAPACHSCAQAPRLPFSCAHASLVAVARTCAHLSPGPILGGPTGDGDAGAGGPGAVHRRQQFQRCQAGRDTDLRAHPAGSVPGTCGVGPAGCGWMAPTSDWACSPAAAPCCKLPKGRPPAASATRHPPIHLPRRLLPAGGGAPLPPQQCAHRVVQGGSRQEACGAGSPAGWRQLQHSRHRLHPPGLSRLCYHSFCCLTHSSSDALLAACRSATST